MNASQIKCILECDTILRNITINIIAIDELPNSIEKYPIGFIVNTSKHYERGEHWLAIYVQNKQNVVFFDSYGKSPEHYSQPLNNFIRSIQPMFKYNMNCLQSSKSIVCGYYCIYFMLFMSRGLTLKDITSHFDDNLINNDIYIFDYIQSIFPFCIA